MQNYKCTTNFLTLKKIYTLARWLSPEPGEIHAVQAQKSHTLILPGGEKISNNKYKTIPLVNSI